jgi:hypothetical protein
MLVAPQPPLPPRVPFSPLPFCHPAVFPPRFDPPPPFHPPPADVNPRPPQVEDDNIFDYEEELAKAAAAASAVTPAAALQSETTGSQLQLHLAKGGVEAVIAMRSRRRVEAERTALASRRRSSLASGALAGAAALSGGQPPSAETAKRIMASIAPVATAEVSAEEFRLRLGGARSHRLGDKAAVVRALLAAHERMVEAGEAPDAVSCGLDRRASALAVSPVHAGMFAGGSRGSARSLRTVGEWPAAGEAAEEEAEEEGEEEDEKSDRVDRAAAAAERGGRADGEARRSSLGLQVMDVGKEQQQAERESECQ